MEYRTSNTVALLWLHKKGAVNPHIIVLLQSLTRNDQSRTEERAAVTIFSKIQRIALIYDQKYLDTARHCSS